MKLVLCKKSIVVKAQFDGFHCWPECPYEEVSYLRNVHRHIFYVEVRLAVVHEERQLEFFMVQQYLKSILFHNFADKEFTFSCETIANIIADKMRKKYPTLYYVSVFEDNENGAIYEIVTSSSTEGGING